MTTILVKELTPLNQSLYISQDTVFSFKLVPVNGAVVDINTLLIEVNVQGVQSVIYNFTDISPEVSIVGVSDSYYIEIDVDPVNAINFNSNDKITLKVDVNDTNGTSMQTMFAAYTVVNMDQLGAFYDVTTHFTEITANYEEARLDYGGTNASFTWKNWLTAYVPEVYKNDIMLDGSSYIVNYKKGLLTFNSSLSTGQNQVDTSNAALYAGIDRINANYMYSAFSLQQVIAFMRTALVEFNGTYPVSSNSLTSQNPLVKAAIILGGAYYMYNFIVSGFINQQFRIQWGEEEWEKLVDIAKTMKENTKSVFEKIKESKQHTLSNPMGIIVSDFSLPGGRSRMFTYMFGHGGTM